MTNKRRRSVFVVIAAALAVLLTACSAGGMINAGLSLVGRVHPIVVTLGTLSAYRGLTLWWLGQDVQIDGDRRAWMAANVAGLPLIAWLGLAVLAIAWLGLSFTVAGREVYEAWFVGQGVRTGVLSP